MPATNTESMCDSSYGNVKTLPKSELQNLPYSDPSEERLFTSRTRLKLEGRGWNYFGVFTDFCVWVQLEPRDNKSFDQASASGL